MAESEQMKKLTEWLNERAPKHSCPVCKKISWAADDDVLDFLQVETKPPRLTALPMIAVYCKNCHHVQFFMAKVILGL